MIEEYRFGIIIIDGKTYNKDVEVIWTGEVLDWWRNESHLVDLDAVKGAVSENPDTIVIGTGEDGLVKITDEAKNYITEKGIKLIIDRTGEAIKTHNVICDDSEEEEGEQEHVIGLFHLTC